MNFPHRAGHCTQQPTGYKAFIPAPLPIEPPIAYSGELQTLLSAADHDIGRLDALASLLPNLDRFVSMYVRHEAVLSSQIEGTQSTPEDVLSFEAEAIRDHTPKDVAEVVTSRCHTLRGSLGEAIGAMNRELVHGDLPVMRGSTPIGGDISKGQLDQFVGRFIAGEVPMRLDDRRRQRAAAFRPQRLIKRVRPGFGGS